MSNAPSPIPRRTCERSAAEERVRPQLIQRAWTTGELIQGDFFAANTGMTQKRVNLGPQNQWARTQNLPT